MSENQEELGVARPVSVIEQYELEHLAMKYGLHPPLAKAGVDQRMREDVAVRSVMLGVVHGRPEHKRQV